MNIKLIKNALEQKKNQEMKFRFNAGRNQFEEFTGKIEKLYNYVFTIKVTGGNSRIKSFSYNDVLTENLKILTK